MEYRLAGIGKVAAEYIQVSRTSVNAYSMSTMLK